ncbi:MAG: nucleotidyltransferase family protein [Nitrospirae bacterium]|nr:nucleotidyltransferase family protein [Nitrospirota bacterium]
MKAMVLAAGLGTRLAPLTHTTPKPLIPLNGQPLITYTLRHLKYYGITDIFVNLHHLGEKIRTFLGDGSAFGVKITYSEEPVILGTGGGIKKLANEFGPAPFLVINSDILTDFNLNSLFAFHQKKKGLAALVLRDDPQADRYGAIEIDSSGRIQRILGKGAGMSNSLKKLMFTGIHLVDPKVLDDIPERVSHSITDTYIGLVLRQKPLFGLEMKGFWADLGTREEYDKMNGLLMEGEMTLPYL